MLSRSMNCQTDISTTRKMSFMKNLDSQDPEKESCGIPGIISTCS